MPNLGYKTIRCDIASVDLLLMLFPSPAAACLGLGDCLWRKKVADRRIGTTTTAQLVEENGVTHGLKMFQRPMVELDLWTIPTRQTFMQLAVVDDLGYASGSRDRPGVAFSVPGSVPGSQTRSSSRFADERIQKLQETQGERPLDNRRKGDPARMPDHCMP